MNPVFDERIKHIKINYHIIHTKLEASMILPFYVPTHFQLTNIFTKIFKKGIF